jgi:hypothetical protein
MGKKVEESGCGIFQIVTTAFDWKPPKKLNTGYPASGPRFEAVTSPIQSTFCTKEAFGRPTHF